MRDTIATGIALVTTSREWLQDNETLLWWLGAFSIVSLILCILATPLIVAGMSDDYFLEDRKAPDESFRGRHPVIRWTTLIIKNLLGVLLVLTGITLLALPGQGLLTMFLGLVLMNFPGKRTLELRIIRIPGILRSINWIRAKSDHAPLKLPQE